MIDGFKLTLSGGEIRTLLDERILEHEKAADRWTREQSRRAEDATDEEPVLPPHMCEHGAEWHAWRARVLAFMRDHIDATDTYRLDAFDLEHGELLPPMPGSVAQEDFAFASAQERRHQAGQTPAADGVLGETDGFIARRIDTGGGPEVIEVRRR